MNIFGLKAFLRAIAIFVSIYIVKIGIELIAQTNDVFLKIIYAIAIIFVVLLTLITPNVFPSTRRENTDKARKTKK